MSDDDKDLPDIPRPRAGTIRNAFLTAMNFDGTSHVIAAYTRAVNEAARATIALGNLNDAQVERERSIKLLKDAGTIHEKDAEDRARELINAKRGRRRAEAKAEIEDLELEQKVLEARQKHEEFLRRHEEGVPTEPEPDEDDLTEAEKEALEEIRASRNPVRAEKIAAILIAEIERRAGEGGLTDDDRAEIEEIRRQAEKIARDSR